MRRVFDFHVHGNFSYKDFREVTFNVGIDFSLDGLLREMRKHGVVAAVVISLPCGRYWSEVLSLKNCFYPIIGVDSGCLDLGLLDSFIDRVLGVKVYVGYDRIDPRDGRLYELYKFLEDKGRLVVFHTGSLWRRWGGYVRYSHPLNFDDVAVDFPELKIILAHAGFPWVRDAAEVAYKNDNVYVDISGWIEESEEVSEYYLNFLRRELKFLVEYCGEDKVLFGSDWPLCRIGRYLDFVMSIGFEDDVLDKILYWNAVRLVRELGFKPP